jgi:hypothetical protein
MPPESLASLLQARQEVNSALKSLKLVNVAERKRKKVEERNHTASSFSASSKKVALILYVLAGYVGSEAAAFLWERKHKRTKPVRDVLGHYAAVVEDWFLALSDEAVEELGSATAERGCACSRKAHAFHEQWHLKDWVARENATKGIAPRSELILLRNGNETRSADSEGADRNDGDQTEGMMQFRGKYFRKKSTQRTIFRDPFRVRFLDSYFGP